MPDGHTDIKFGSEVLEKVADFKYLGSIKSADGTCLKDIKNEDRYGKTEDAPAAKPMERQQHPH